MIGFVDSKQSPDRAATRRGSFQRTLADPGTGVSPLAFPPREPALLVETRSVPRLLARRRARFPGRAGAESALASRVRAPCPSSGFRRAAVAARRAPPRRRPPRGGTLRHGAALKSAVSARRGSGAPEREQQPQTDTARRRARRRARGRSEQLHFQIILRPDGLLAPKKAHHSRSLERPPLRPRVCLSQVDGSIRAGSVVKSD